MTNFEPTDFAMFSPKGNRAVAKICKKVFNLKIVATEEDIYDLLTKEMNEVAKLHPEVWDTSVRSSMIGYIESKIARDLTIYF